jgi:ABC-type Fe3+ transport system substrate-binding protein
MIRNLIAGLLAAAIALPAAAQGTWMQSPAVKALHDKAKAEGEVVFWGTAPREVDWIPAAFAKAFPGVTVKATGDNNIATTALAEARANRNQVDVFWHGLAGAAPLLDRQLIAKTDWSVFGVTPDNTAADGRLGYTNNVVYAFMYNDRKADKALLPKSWADLRNPGLKDKMAASEFLLPRITGGIAIVQGRETAMTWARGLRDEMGVMVTRAPREPMLQAGERLYSIVELDQQVRLWKADGLDVGYVVPEPIIAAQFVAAVMAKAPHPAGATLLAGWLASSEGKAAREAAILTADYRPGSTSPIAAKLFATGAKINFDDLSQVETRTKFFREAAEILSGQMR